MKPPFVRGVVGARLARRFDDYDCWTAAELEGFVARRHPDIDATSLDVAAGVVGVEHACSHVFEEFGDDGGIGDCWCEHDA